MKTTNLILLALNLFYLVLPVKANPVMVAQSNCQQAINTVTNEIRKNGITDINLYIDNDKMNFLRNPIANKTFVIGLNSSKTYLINNILASRTLMKNWAVNIIKQCENIGYVMIGNYNNSDTATYALNVEGQLFIYYCDDNPKNLINPDSQPEYSSYDNSYCAYVPYDSFENAIASNLLLEFLSQKCRNEISKNQPTIKINDTELKLTKEKDGELSLHWSNSEGLFFESDKLELDVASKIGRACPEISMVGYHGGIGGASRWYIRSTKFSQKHYRDSGLPGDFDKYWNWLKIPTNYNPYYDYVNE